MRDKLSRPWFRFSLRTLLIAVTMLSCWLAWESSVVRQRRAMMREFQATSAVHFTTADDWGNRWPASAPPRKVATVSWMRRILGDVAIQEIWYHQPPPEAELRRLHKTFPEAEVHEVLAEPCHPGCFPRGTLVETPDGPRAIESIRVGDSLVAFLSSGEPVTVPVQSIFVTQNRLWRVETSAADLLTTETQPLCLSGCVQQANKLAAAQIVPAGELQPGDPILRREDGETAVVQVVRVVRTDHIETVYNLVLEDSEIFVAGGFLARSKPPAEIAGR